MPKKSHTEEQIVGVLRQVEAGARVAEVCRKVGISEATLYPAHTARRTMLEGAIYHGDLRIK
jgi:putative transposase